MIEPVVLVRLLKRSNRSTSFDTVVDTRKMPETKLVTTAKGHGVITSGVEKRIV